MRIGRTILIPAILTLSVAGSILAGSAISSASAHAPSVHVQASASVGSTDVFYHV